jgi:SAM-dependent methyltransferase
LNCLEIGAREGGISLWLALKGYYVLCSDLTQTAELARPLHARYGVEDRITYMDIDATRIPFENKFDVVVFKSILGGIGRNDNAELQRRVIRQLYKSLKPGGLLLFAENGRASRLHRFFRRRYTKWGSDWRYLTREEISGFLTPFTSAEIRSTGFAGVFGRNEKQKIFLSWIDKVFFNALVPTSWNYILYGSAVK